MTIEERIVEQRFMGTNRQERWIRWYVEDDGSLTYRGCGIEPVGENTMRIEDNYPQGVDVQKNTKFQYAGESVSGARPHQSKRGDEGTEFPIRPILASGMRIRLDDGKLYLVGRLTEQGHELAPVIES